MPEQASDTRIFEIGAEQTPIIVIDNFVDDLDGLLQTARQQDYASDTTFYPGVRCQLPESYTQAALERLIPLICSTYGARESTSYELYHNVFSLLAQPPESLSMLQRIPHFDTTRDYYFASVHYLSPGQFCGTGFFRHRPTGFERVSTERHTAFVGAAKRHMLSHGEPPPGYINASTDHFELIGEIEYRPNRIVLYPGNLLHSGMVVPERDLNLDPNKGRLTANLFLDFDIEE
ncbi:MAG: DUF6445 family protein [Woeseiaceae bacterium]